MQDYSPSFYSFRQYCVSVDRMCNWYWILSKISE